MNFQNVYTGFDGLDLSYRTILPAPALARLEQAKRDAIKTRSQVAMRIGDIECTVSGSGSQGGYQYTVDTGPLGAIWFFKDDNRSDPWGCRVSMKSLSLALFGAEEMKQRCDLLLESLGISLEPSMCRISRVDYAMDFVIPGFALDPNNFVSHSKSKKFDYREIETTRTCDVVTSVRIGKMPGIQLGVYDKRKDIIAKGKDYWWDIWAGRSERKLARDQPVWRFELRAGRKAIDSYYATTSWELISHCIQSLLGNIAGRIRMVTPQDDTNRSRWPDDPIWAACRELLSKIPPHATSNVASSTILAKLKDERLTQLASQYFGVEMSIAAATDHSLDEFDDLLDILATIRRERHEVGGDWVEKKLAEKRAVWKARFS